MVFKKYHHMTLVGLLAYQRGALQRFYKFSNKFPEHLNNKERRSYYLKHISNINYFDKHVFLKISFTSNKVISMEQNICKPTIGNMQSKWNTLIHFEFDFNDLQLRFIQTHESKRVERQGMHKPSFLKRSPPHLNLYLVLHSKLNVETKQWLCRF